VLLCCNASAEQAVALSQADMLASWQKDFYTSCLMGIKLASCQQLAASTSACHTLFMVRSWQAGGLLT
jgi:hypothetical protein